jgi:hypothetical protein
MIDDLDDQEWLRQEQARQAERSGLDLGDADASKQAYRLVARELAQDRDAPLPGNFAHAHSSRIETLARQSRREQVRFARMGFAWFCAIAGIGAIVAMAVYGREWWSALHRSGWLNSPIAAWLMAVAGCGLLSWLLAGRARRSAPGIKPRES